MKILVVEDDRIVGQYVKRGLEEQQYHADLVDDGLEALRLVSGGHYDLIVLDLRLPGMTGYEILRTVRDRGITTPILVLTAQDAVDAKVTALRAGADDYVTKPFGMNEFLARVRAALRRAATSEEAPILTTADFTIDLGAKRVHRGDEELHLTPTEWQIVEVLARHTGKLVPQQQLLQQVWGPQYERETHYLRIYMSQIRRKLEPDPSRPRYFITEPGMGYRFVVEEH